MDIEDKCETITQIAIKTFVRKKKLIERNCFMFDFSFPSVFGNVQLNILFTTIMSGAVENKRWNESRFSLLDKNALRHMASSLANSRAKLEKLNYKVFDENRERKVFIRKKERKTCVHAISNCQ